MRVLNDGTKLPHVGLGTYPLLHDEAERAVNSALEMGYRLIDTAVNYGNEASIGVAIANSFIPRSQIRVVTKLPGRDHGYEETFASFESSRKRLALDYVDIYLIHWPNPSVGKYVETWRAMIKLQQDGLAKTIGVSNFTQEFILRLANETGVLPALNQIEVHPFLPQQEMRHFHEAHGIATVAWSPFSKDASRLLEEEPVRSAATAHSATPAQTVMKWHSQIGVVPIPKSGDARRQEENLSEKGFLLSPREMSSITALARPSGRWFGGDPNVHEEM